jgi:hypothetical protein
MKTTDTTSKAAEKAMSRIDYWMQRRIEATTAKALEHAREMERRAIRAYDRAITRES